MSHKTPAPVQAFGASPADGAQAGAHAPSPHFTDSHKITREHSAGRPSLDLVLAQPRLAARRLLRAPSFAVLAALILAVGIGSNVAVFCLANELLLRALPFPEPSRLLHVTALFDDQSNLGGCLSYPHWRVLAEPDSALPSLAGYTQESFNWTEAGSAAQLPAGRVSANFFDVLGVKPAFGRAFRAAEDVPGKSSVVVLSDRFWRANLAARPDILGRSLHLNGRPYSVVGVLPASFRFAPLGTTTDLWTPSLTELNLLTPEQVQAGSCYVNAIGRLRPSVSLRGAEAGLLLKNQRFLREYKDVGDADPKHRLEVVPLREKQISAYRRTVFALGAAVALLFLIACSNLGGLLLARSVDRQKEFAVRIALGATRPQLGVQILAESACLALLGGLGGLLLGLLGVHLFSQSIAKLLPAAEALPLLPDWHVALFALLLSAAAAVLCSLAPVARLSARSLSAAIHEQGRGTAGSRRRNHLRSLLVIAQVALSALLVMDSGLLVRSYQKLAGQPLGFQAPGILTMNVSLPPARYPAPERIVQYFEHARSSAAGVPGVRAAALSSALPVNESRLAAVLAEGQAVVPLARRPLVALQSVTPEYQRLLHIPLLQGRFFSAFDRRGGLRVAVINQAFAHQFFGRSSPLGRRIFLGRRAEPWLVVGVIGDIKNLSLSSATQAEIDLPFSQFPSPQMNLLLRTSTDPKSVAGAVRASLTRQDPQQPITAMQTMDELLAESCSQTRVVMLLLVAFAFVALLLAMAGLYSILSYSTGQRAREWGVRLALGATHTHLVTSVLRQAGLLAGSGILLGLAGSLLLSKLISHLIFGITIFDPLTLLAVPLLFAAAALLAGCVPALRTMRIAPAAALRNE